MSKAFVAILMGSDSDLPLLENTMSILKGFGIPYEARVASAHRTPDVVCEYVKDADLIRYGQRLEYAPIRRNKMLWDTGRTISSYQKIPGATDLLKMYKRADTIRNIGTFEERLAKLRENSFSNMFTKPHLFLNGMSKLDKEFGILSNSSSSLE